MIRIAVVVIALLSGTAAGWLALQATWREPPEADTVVMEEPRVDVLTPRIDLRRGARISTGHLEWTPWPERQVRAGMIRRDNAPDAAQDMAGRILRSNLYAGEPVREAHLATGDGGFLSTVLQPGMRAVGVPVSEEMTAGGFVLPNDRVDVLHTVIRDLDGDGTATGATRTILTNVRVLAIGQTTFGGDALVVDPEAAEPTAGRGEALTGKTATLEVATEQAEVLMAAGASGELSLALRAADDFGLSGMGDLTMIEGRAPEVGTTDLAGDAADDAARRHEIRLISAGTVETVVTPKRGTR